MQGIIKCNCEIDKDSLELINSYTRREYKSDELYVFKVVLCDNDIDRDGEAFSIQALQQMSNLFVGKTGITDHNPSANNQTARIFSCTVEKVDNMFTSFGGEYYCLVAMAYIPRTEATNKTIQLIESGIVKEVSVGCCTEEVICSICGENVAVDCGHFKNQLYGEKQCYHILNQISDAYEWSFVAVPSQRRAGVTKGYRDIKRGVNIMDIIQQVKKGNYKAINGENILELAKYIEKMEEHAEYGKAYRQQLEKEYIRYGGLCFKDNNGVIASTAKKLSVNELEECVRLYKNAVQGNGAFTPQLITDDKKLDREIYDKQEYSI